MTMKSKIEIEVLAPEDLALLKAVVEDVCSADPGSDESRRALVAAAAVELYQCGITDRESLRGRLRAL